MKQGAFIDLFDCFSDDATLFDTLLKEVPWALHSDALEDKQSGTADVLVAQPRQIAYMAEKPHEARFM